MHLAINEKAALKSSKRVFEVLDRTGVDLTIRWMDTKQTDVFLANDLENESRVLNEEEKVKYPTDNAVIAMGDGGWQCCEMQHYEKINGLISCEKNKWWGAHAPVSLHNKLVEAAINYLSGNKKKVDWRYEPLEKLP